MWYNKNINQVIMIINNIRIEKSPGGYKWKN